MERVAPLVTITAITTEEMIDSPLVVRNWQQQLNLDRYHIQSSGNLVLS